MIGYSLGMRHLSSILVLGALLASCKAEDKPAPAEAPTTPASVPAAPAAAPAATPTAPAEPAEPAAPEPSTPQEMELALKAAMVAGKDAEVIKYCEMLGVKPGSGDGQMPLGCALASCRSGQADKAKMWATGLPKALRKQAITICMANKVVL